MSSRSRVSSVLGLVLVAVASAGVANVGGRANSPRFQHASLAAYPNAVISLKDAKTGMTFYVESDGRKLVALDREGALAWGIDVLAEAKVTPAVGKPVIRHLSLDGGRLSAVCGKHDFVQIDVATGDARHTGAD